MLKPGDAALDFVLKDHANRDVRLSSFSGRPIVLFFYPKDLTPGCTIQAKGLRNQEQALAKHNAIVVGVSLDAPEKHQEFQDTCGLEFPLLSDQEGHVHDLYDAWRTTLFGRTPAAVRRCTFVIDRDGIVRAVHKNVNIFTHAKAIVRDLERIAAQTPWGKGRKVEANGEAPEAKH